MQKPNLQRLWALLLTLGLVLASAPDVLLEIIHSVEKHGPVLGLLAAIFYIRKEIDRHKSKRRDKILEAKLDAIGKAVGAEWDPFNGQPHGLTRTPHPRLKRLFLFSRKVINRGNPRRKKTMEKLKSRKFWLAIIGALVPVVNQEYGLNLDENTIIAIIGLFGVAIAGIAHVDAKKAANNTTLVQVGGASNEESKPAVQSAK